MRKYREYSDEDVIKYAKEVKSMAKLLTKLGLKTVGGNYNHMKHTLQRLQIDTSHWTGKAWNRNERLKDWSQYSRVNGLKKHLIELRGHQCENCKNFLWFEHPITLEVHHKDGDKTNNSLDNLQLLCPNCHSLTDNWRKHKNNK